MYKLKKLGKTHPGCETTNGRMKYRVKASLAVGWLDSGHHRREGFNKMSGAFLLAGVIVPPEPPAVSATIIENAATVRHTPNQPQPTREKIKINDKQSKNKTRIYATSLSQ